jgi:hypothetical protein
LFLTLSSSAYADEASKHAKAQQLFVLMRMEQTYSQLIAQVTAQSRQMVQGLFPEGTPMSDAQKKEAADFEAKANALILDEMSWSVLEPDYVKLYADTYTEEDLDGIIAFYRSPVGVKMLEKTPELLQASSAIAMNHMGVVEPKLRKLMDEFQQQIKSGTDRGNTQ